MTPADVIDEPAQQQRPERAGEPVARKRNTQRQATPPVEPAGDYRGKADGGCARSEDGQYREAGIEAADVTGHLRERGDDQRLGKEGQADHPAGPEPIDDAADKGGHDDQASRIEQGSEEDLSRAPAEIR